MDRIQKALVLGLGTSGQAAAELLHSRGVRVTVVDESDSDAVRQRAEMLKAQGLEVVHPAANVPEASYDVAVVSPGISVHHAFVQWAYDRAVPVTSELELGWRFLEGRVLGVTGSNGKSTFVKWCAKALQEAGKSVCPAGNYGLPICRAVLEKPRRDVWILEVSSFQLETSSRFCPDVGVLLNILPNHLDRHGTMASYTRCKAKLFAACGAGATGLVPLEWLEPMQVQSGAQLRWQTFGTSAQATAWYRDGWIHLADGLKVDIRGTLYDHAVTGAAAAAALLALQAFGVDAGHAVDALRDMEPLPHRLQWAGQIGDIPCYNDSKATNLAALQAAVLRSPAPVRLIAGGLPKQKDFTSVQEVLAERVCSVYLIGKASEEMFAAWSDCVPCRRCGTLDQALQSAAKDAQKGECILLAPGCASFDQFCNYAERGEHFIQSIQCLAEKKQK